MGANAERNIQHSRNKDRDDSKRIKIVHRHVEKLSLDHEVADEAR